MIKNWKKHLRYAPDDAPIAFGTGKTAQLLWSTDDDNANAFYLVLPDGGSVDVPAFIVGTAGLADKDLALLNGTTFALLGVADNDEDAYVGLTYASDDTPAIKSNKGTLDFLLGDTDDYVRIAVVSNIPTIYGVGAYLRIGDAGTTSNSLNAEDDLLVSGELEVNGIAYFDQQVLFQRGAGTNSAGLLDDNYLSFGSGSDASVTYETADGDAKALVFALPHTTEDANNVPVAVFGDKDILNVDLGFFDTVTVPMVATVAADRGGYFAFGCDNDDILAIKATTSPTADNDESKFSHKLQCDINGSTYYIMLTQS